MQDSELPEGKAKDDIDRSASVMSQNPEPLRP